MKLDRNLLRLAVLLTITASRSNGQIEPKIAGATPAVLQAFQSHDIVMLGEAHGNKQEHDWLRAALRLSAIRPFLKAEEF